jgi:hypothetical protein
MLQQPAGSNDGVQLMPGDSGILQGNQAHISKIRFSSKHVICQHAEP